MSGKRYNSARTICIAAILFWIFSLVHTVQAASFFEQFIDPHDGKFDASNWILNKKGFLPVPIIITEPAVGYGAGAALLFFHAKKDEPYLEETESNLQEGSDEHEPRLPPSITGLVGLGTENGTWAAGGFHFGTWKKDSMRYTGGVIYPSVNLSFYGSGNSPILENGLDYNLEGWFLLQELIFRLQNSNFFLGPKLIYYNIDSKFEFNKLPIDPWQLNIKSYGLGLKAVYDSRDNFFTPNTGINADISALYYSVENDLTGSKEYRMIDGTGRFYWQLFSDIILGWRLYGGFSSGDVPFYALPYINLRGIPAMRYQGENVLTTEIETRWNVNERWSLVFFGGVGRTADSLDDFSGSEDRWAGGTGFRYLVARALDLYSGIDFAWGPEDFVFYIQTGSAW
ncbi:glyceraldehyde-3-phosphate dehydrogenase [Thermodesulfobacteriota bacterium]